MLSVKEKLFLATCVAACVVLNLQPNIDKIGKDQKDVVTLASRLVPKSPGLWIHVSSWGEGLSGWTRAMYEILAMARQLNATVVEPCIRGGRLRDCDAEDLVRFGDVFDMNVLRRFHPRIASFADFQRQTVNASTYYTCGFPQNLDGPHISFGCQGMTSFYDEETSLAVEQAVAEGRNGTTVVLDVKSLRQGSLGRMSIDGAPLNIAIAMNNFWDYVQFKKDHYDFVEELLRRLGVVEPFHVMHWRGELRGMDYIGCVHKIVEAKEIMEANSLANFILLSSLSTHEQLQWGGARAMARNSTSGDALQLLLDAGFHKLDTVINQTNVGDMIFLVVWDLIVATKATKLATCDVRKGMCSGSCRKCNYAGKFSTLVVELRQAINKSSLKCWPERT